jgi:hypothetical protein
VRKVTQFGFTVRPDRTVGVFLHSRASGVDLLDGQPLVVRLLLSSASSTKRRLVHPHALPSWRGSGTAICDRARSAAAGLSGVTVRTWSAPRHCAGGQHCAGGGGTSRRTAILRVRTVFRTSCLQTPRFSSDNIAERYLFGSRRKPPATAAACVCATALRPPADTGPQRVSEHCRPAPRFPGHSRI